MNPDRAESCGLVVVGVSNSKYFKFQIDTGMSFRLAQHLLAATNSSESSRARNLNCLSNLKTVTVGLVTAAGNRDPATGRPGSAAGAGPSATGIGT